MKMLVTRETAIMEMRENPERPRRRGKDASKALISPAPAPSTTA